MLMGVPKRFCKTTINDFKVYRGLSDVKSFVVDYLNHIDENLDEGKGIFFCGSNGVGKTMLSCIILKEAYRKRYTCRRVTFSQYLNSYTESWGASKDERSIFESDFIAQYKGVDFLVLEEVGKEIDSKIAKPILEDLLRYREEHGYATIICSNLDLPDFKECYGNSICSLINGSQTIVKIVAKDRRGEN